jgi:uncharacterized protein (DUF924 family)
MILHKILTILVCSVHINCLADPLKNEPLIEEVLTYWFGDLKSPDEYPQEQSRLWFSGGESVDQEIRKRFGFLVDQAMDHKLDDWKKTPRGRLALIILIDQFSRNIYRGTAKAFSGDLLALDLVFEGLAVKEDEKLFPIERVFFYLPLEHSEDVKIQELSVHLFHKLSLSSPAFTSFLDYALRHYEIIEKFGRFPHRNSLLGRESTLEEIEFLKSPHSSF